MKKILFFACIITTITFTSCGDSGTTDSSNNGDTAVLVEDPENTLEASPVNDTLVADTVQTNR